MRKVLTALILTGLMVMLMTGISYAAHENPGDRTKTVTATNCVECHENTTKHTSGPHGGYTNTTDKCGTCHDVHAVEGNAMLLPGTTLTAACNYCHDLTGTAAGPYYGANGGMTVAAAHRVVGINVNQYTDTEGEVNNTLTEGITTIPGGNGVDGSAGTLDTSSQGQLSGAVFTCDSCHTPHGVNVVEKYLGESEVKYTNHNMPAGTFKLYLTNRILKKQPNKGANDPIVTAPVQYGASWCASCHKGRTNDIQQKHNHPVDLNAPAYRFLDLAAPEDYLNNNTKDTVVSDGVIYVDTNETTVLTNAEMKKDPRSNKQYSMTAIDELTNTARPDGYTDISNYPNGPACQQCHGSSRDVEAAFVAENNPLRLNFPHISDNKGLLVEIKDDLCTNCHAPSVLP